MPNSPKRVLKLLAQAKALAKEYRALTGRPLGITGEVAEYEAVRLLGLELADVRQAGYDAIRRIGRKKVRLQVKGRCLLPGCSPSQRVGNIKLTTEWDAVLLVLMNADFEAKRIYEASRADVTAALTAPGSKARNERGSLAVSKFKSIGRLVWSRHHDLAA